MSQTETREAALLEQALFQVKRVIVGQNRAIERMLVCLLANGHCLLEGVPGLAKTLAVETLAKVSGGTFARIQFTPDLLPADIMGTRIYRASTERFDIELGPVFANFVLADEINRAPAKVQSALLEVMAERQVSIAGKTHPVPTPFLVLATQNPIESEGVYPLPEAQRDRFLMKIVVPYPSAQEEMEIARRMGGVPPQALQVLEPADVLALQEATRNVYVDPAVLDYVVRLVLATREPAQHGLADLTGQISCGASPRATLGLVAAARALALMRDQDYVTPQEVFDVGFEVLNHRIVLSYEALAEGIDPADIVRRVLSTVYAPVVTPSQLRAAAGQ
ncbi:MAG: AAA family ATPase [Acidimicrobiia bacterium]